MITADAVQDHVPLAATFLRFLPLLAIPVWIFVIVKIGGFKGPSHLNCENCGAPAYKRTQEIDWKFQGPARDFIDICPNCGNDNRIKFNA